MIKKRCGKSIVCILLALLMFLSPGLEPLAGSGLQIALAAENDAKFKLTAAELALGTNVIPAEQVANGTFMSNYVKSSGTKLNLNGRFKRTNASHVKGAEATLPVGTMGPSSSSKHWMAQYTWTLNEQEKKYLTSSEFELVYEGTLIPNKHNHVFGDDHWNDAYVTLRGQYWDGGTDYGGGKDVIMGISTKRNDRVTLNVHETIDLKDSRDALYFTAMHSGGQACGGPSVSGNVFYFVDTQAPYITGMYLSSDADGSTIRESYTRFDGSSSLTSYVVLEFSENIRLADNYKNTEALTLELAAYYGKESGYTADSNYNLTATLVKLEGNKMIFSFQIPSTMSKGNTHVYINGIRGTQSFQDSCDLVLFDGNGAEYATRGLTATSRITDLAGNSLKWAACTKSMNTYYFDNVAPSLKSINMTGSMITANSTKEPTGWEDNSAKDGSNFAGVGDKIGYEVYFSEGVRVPQDLKAVLSITDGAGKPIELKLKYIDGDRIVFQDLTITDKMKTAGQRIRIVSFKSGDANKASCGITDYAGNMLTTNLSSDIPVPGQQIFLDIDKPGIDTSLVPDGEIYYTNNETEEGECFTIPLTFEEDKKKASSPYFSTINDRPVYFVLQSEGGSQNFAWYVDTEDVSNLDKFKNASVKKDGITVSEVGNSKYMALEKVSDGVPYYLHIRLDAGIDYRQILGAIIMDGEDKGVYFDGTLHVFVEDWAGNPTSTSYRLSHQVDIQKPTVNVEAPMELSVDYTENRATITAGIEANDNYGFAAGSYYWRYRLCDNEGNLPTAWTESAVTPIENIAGSIQLDSQISFTYAFDPEKPLENRVGEFQLILTASDYHGNTNSFSSNTFSYNFTKPTGQYRFEGGSLQNPVTIPTVYIGPAYSKSDQADTARTVLMLRFPGDAENCYYLYDPLDYQKASDYDPYPSKTPSYPSELFEPLYQRYLNKEVWPLSNYGTWYQVEMTEDENNNWTCEAVGPLLSDYVREAFLEKLFTKYGSVQAMFVTSTDFGEVENDLYDEEKLSFNSGSSVITTTTFYLANDAQYGIDIQPAKDKDGQDISAILEYSRYDDKNTYPTLDHVSVTLRVTNETDLATEGNVPEIPYGYGALDYANSDIQLRYLGTDRINNESELLAITPLKTWELARTGDGLQTIVFEEGLAAKSGWYSLTVTVININGTPVRETRYYFIDKTQLDLSMDAYYKKYTSEEDKNIVALVRDGNVGSLYSFDENSQSEQETILGVIDCPDGWTESTYLRFARGKRTDRMWVEENIKIRVRNATYDMLNLEAAGADSTDALWIDASFNGYNEQSDPTGTLDDSYRYYYYVPKLVTQYQAGAYGADTDTVYYDETGLVLPVLDGYNLLVYEIQNTNGTISSHEVPVYVHGQVEEWSLDYTMKTRGEYVQSVTVGPVVLSDLKLDHSTFYHVPSIKESGMAKRYTLVNDVNTSFYLLDQNGNMSKKDLALYNEDGTLLDVDGVSPREMYLIDRGSTTYNGYGMYCFDVEVRDIESAVSAKDVTITFDEGYSAVLMGLTGDARTYNEEKITMSLPLAVDENGNYRMDPTNPNGSPYAVWEAYEVGNNGIFRTQILEEYVTESGMGVLTVRFWGVIKNNQEGLDGDWTLEVTATDIYGNAKSVERQMGYYTMDPYLLTGQIADNGTANIDSGLLENGELGFFISPPVAKIHGYGAGDSWQEALYMYTQPMYFNTAPMIVSDGTYTMHVTDLFGEEYDLELNVYSFGELGVDVSFSTADPTNQPVTVTAVATGNQQTIASIVADDGTVGTVDPVDPSKAQITVNDNCSITITTKPVNDNAEPITRVVQVLNIDKVLGETYFQYYDYKYSPMNVSATGDTVEGEVTVYLMCDEEELVITNGPDRYTFPEGSKKGDSYTFEYRDDAGNVGSKTVILPFDIVGKPDEEAPEILLTVYGMRNGRNEYGTDLLNPVDRYEDADGDPETDTDITFIQGGTEINNVLAGYKAQQLTFMLTITDVSATRVIVQPTGQAAPTAYPAANSCTAANVSLAVNNRTATVVVHENTSFDVYIIDEMGNMTAITGIQVTGIDKTAPVLYPDYEVGTDPDTGFPSVIATFLPEDPAETFDLIVPISTDVLSKWMEEPTGDYVMRYYTVFGGNGDYTFHYQDEYGNRGESTASIYGMDTAAAVVNSVIWNGTVGNSLPSVSPVVNRDVTAELNMNKPISEVELYEYNEQMSDGIGALLDADAPVRASFTGTNIYVTYTDRVDYEIVVVYTASRSGRKGSYILPAVSCIDKKAPVVTLVKTELASNHRSAVLTFTADETALLVQNATMGYLAAEEEHTWIGKSNEAKDLIFMDQAGNQVTYTVKDLGIDEADLEILYSLTGTDEDAITEPIGNEATGAKGLELDAGESFYIKLTKKASVVLDGENQGKVEAGVWTKLTLENEAGLHILQCTDDRTGDVVYGLVAVQPKDNVAPVIQITADTVVLEEGISREAMLTAIRDGVTVTDDVDGELMFSEAEIAAGSAGWTVAGIPDETEAGLYSLEYTARDTSGNQAVVYRSLYIMAEGTPILWINGEPGLPYGKITLSSGENITLRLENMMEDEPVIIKYRSGIKTTGQVKYNSTIVENMTFSVEEPGHYTIYVRSQSRVEYVTYIYVEDK